MGRGGHRHAQRHRLDRTGTLADAGVPQRSDARRIPLVVLNMARAQGDYWQATRGPGHGDSRMPVLAPMDVPEAIALTQLAFELAYRWRNPVLLFGDYYLAHTASSVDVTPFDAASLSADDWALTGATSGTGNARLVSPLGSAEYGARAATPTTSWSALWPPR